MKGACRDTHAQAHAPTPQARACEHEAWLWLLAVSGPIAWLRSGSIDSECYSSCFDVQRLLACVCGGRSHDGLPAATAMAPWVQVGCPVPKVKGKDGAVALPPRTGELVWVCGCVASVHSKCMRMRMRMRMRVAYACSAIIDFNELMQ